MLKEIVFHKIVTAKVHCKLRRKIKQKCLCSSTHLSTYKNFCVYRYKNEDVKFTYIIFKSGFVNICGIKNFPETIIALKQLCKIVKRTKNWKKNFIYLKGRKKIIPDNITVHGKLRKQIPSDFYSLDLWIKKQLKDSYKSNFNYLHFPGLFLSPKGKRGKIVLFRNGKFNLLGMKCSQDIQNTLKELDAFISIMWMMHMKE